MLVWLLLGYVLFSLVFGVLVGTGIRMQRGEPSGGGAARAPASRPAEAPAGTGEPAGLRRRVAAGR